MASAWLGLCLCILLTGTLFAATPVVTVSDNGPTIPRYDIYELTMAHSGTYTYPNDDVTITAVFTSPSSKTYTIGGFYYDINTWKLRFAPMETGVWTWSLTFDNGSGQYTTSGSLTCSPSSSSGFIRIHPQNSKRFMTEADGKPFYVNGYNIGYTNSGNVSPMTGFVDANQPLTRLPLLDIFNTYRRGGLNIFRCNMQAMTDYLATFNVKGTGKNAYDIAQGKRQDELVMALHQSGLKLMMDFFPWALPTSAKYDITSPGNADAIVSLHKHMLNRFSAYVDIWEMGNEVQNVTQPYMDLITSTVHANDPYDHILTISYQQQSLDETALTAANTHTYINKSNLVMDLDWINATNSLKTGLGIWNGGTFGTGTNAVYVPSVRECYPTKPIFAGECGNQAPIGNYDPERYRINLWTTITNESGPIFWLRIDSKFTYQASGLSNTYIGSEERGMSRVVMNLVKDLDPAVNSLYPSGAVVCSPSANVRGYAMGSSQNIIGYFLHSNDHSTDLTNGQVTLPIPADGMQGQWIDPATGNILQNFTVNSGTQTLNVPSFKCDIALRVRPSSSAPVLEFGSASYAAREDRGSVTVTVNRSISSSGAVSVQYATADGLAVAGQNYTAASGTLTWADGDMTPKQIVIPLQDNPVGQTDKDFQIFLGNPTGGATLGGNDNTLVAVFDATSFGRPGITSALAASGTTTVPFSYNIAATNTPTSFDATGLPAGLSLDPASGVISGTPAISGTFPVTLSAINASGTGAATLALVVQPFVLLPPVITSSLNASGTAGSAFSYTITATNNPSSFAASGLPTGLSINTATGVISGTFTAAGTYTCTIGATNSGGSDSKALILGVSGVAGIRFVYEGFDYATTSNISTAADSPSDIGLTGTNWSGSNKVLAPGLSYPGISSTGNALQFTSNLSSSRSFDMTAVPGGYTQVDTDSVTRIGKPGCTVWIRLLMRADVTDTTGTMQASLNLGGAASGGGTKLCIGITGTNGNAAYSGFWNIYKNATVAATSNVPIVTGSTVMLVTRIYYGVGTNKDEVDLYVNPPADVTPPATPNASLRNLSVGTIDRVLFQGRRQSTADELSIGTDWMSAVMPILPPVISSTLAASGTTGSAFSYNITATNTPTSFSASGLPAGLTLNTATGVISGTPTASGIFTVALGAANGSGLGTATLTLTVQQTYAGWTSSYGLSGANALDMATPARDGIPNLIKYALGLNPSQTCIAATDGVQPGLPLGRQEGNSLTLTYQKDTTKSDLTYTVETSSDLMAWITAGITDTLQSTSGNIQTRKAAVLTGTANRQFIHLKITK